MSEINDAVEDIIQHIEENYQNLLISSRGSDNALKRYIFLTEMIDIMDDAPDFGYPVMRSAILVRLYAMRSDIAVDAEFIKIAYNL